MKNLTITLLTAVTLLATTSVAQENAGIPTEGATEVEKPKNPKNIIRTRPFKTGISVVGPMPININLSYERVLGRAISLGLTAEYGLTKNFNIPSQIKVAGIPTFQLNSLGVAPELRIYPGKKHAPKGLYFAFTGYYSQFTASTTVNVKYPYPIDVPGYGTYDYEFNRDLTLKGTSTFMGGSIGLGSQWIAGKHVAIDVLWIGLGGGIMNLAFKIDGPLVDKSEIEQDILVQTGYPITLSDSDVPTWESVTKGFEDQISDGLNSIPYFGNKWKLSAETDGIKLAMNTFAPKLRLLNFSIGIAF